MELLFSLIGFLAMLIALATHEFSHAWASTILGDDTARRAGRLTLNPAAHIDPIGTLLIPLMGALSGFPLIGWAKPVPFNQYNLKYRRWGPTIVALAGPISNFVFAFICIVMLKIGIEIFKLQLTNLLVIFLLTLIIINITLGIFNFIPVPPLDGSKLLRSLLDSPKYHNFHYFMETRGPMLLLFFIIADSFSPAPILGGIFRFVVRGIFNFAGLDYFGSVI